MTSSTFKLPSQDPWYEAPAGFDDVKPPGTILRIRSAPGDLLSKFSNSSAIYNILFRTTDTHYQPSWAVTTLFVPKSSNGEHLLSHQIPYNCIGLDGVPSALVYRAGPEFWPELIEVVQEGLSRGWYVNVPDHEGPLGALGDGVVAGHSTLDAIRASINAGFGMDRTKTRIASWGFSGGAFAAGWAAQLQPHYAPELTFAGAAMGGLPSDVRIFDKLKGPSMFAGLVPVLLLGLTAQHPKARDYIVSSLKDSHSDDFMATVDYDILKTFQTFAGQNMFDYFTNGVAVLDSPLLKKAFARRAQLGFHGVPQMPLFLYKAIDDELAAIGLTDDLYEHWRQVDVDLLYERNTVGGHLEEFRNGRPRALEWLSQAFDGTLNQKGCTRRDVTVSVDQ